MNRSKPVRILILEDTPEAIDALVHQLNVYFEDSGGEWEVEHFATQQAVEMYVNKQPADYYDVVFLDYFAKDGNFHVLDIEKFNQDRQKIISISSMREKNELAQRRGVGVIVQKTHHELEAWAKLAASKIKEIV